MPRRKYNNPSYESPLEEAFAIQLRKYLKPNVLLQEQKEVETAVGKFRLDFFIMCGDQKIGFECDGQNYHDSNTQIYDKWRDILILCEKEVDIIFRMGGTVFIERIIDFIFLLSQILPSLFKKNTLNDLLSNASKEALMMVKKSIDSGLPAENLLLKVDYPAKDWISLFIEPALQHNHQAILHFVKNNPRKRLNPLIYKFNKLHGHYGV